MKAKYGRGRKEEATATRKERWALLPRKPVSACEVDEHKSMRTLRHALHRRKTEGRDRAASRNSKKAAKRSRLGSSRSITRTCSSSRDVKARGAPSNDTWESHGACGEV